MEPLACLVLSGRCRAVETALSRSDKRKGEKGAAPLGGTLLMGKGYRNGKEGLESAPLLCSDHPHVRGWEMGNGFNPCFRSDYCSAAGEWESDGFRRHLPPGLSGPGWGWGSGVGAGLLLLLVVFLFILVLFLKLLLPSALEAFLLARQPPGFLKRRWRGDRLGSSFSTAWKIALHTILARLLLEIRWL